MFDLKRFFFPRDKKTIMILQVLKEAQDWYIKGFLPSQIFTKLDMREKRPPGIARVYNTLPRLEKLGYIKSFKDFNRVRWCITPNGEAFLNQNKR